MITASVSLSPIVAAVAVAENQVQKRIILKVVDDEIKKEANLVAKTVTQIATSNKQSKINSHTPRSIDFRA